MVHLSCCHQPSTFQAHQSNITWHTCRHACVLSSPTVLYCFSLVWSLTACCCARSNSPYLQSLRECFCGHHDPRPTLVFSSPWILWPLFFQASWPFNPFQFKVEILVTTTSHYCWLEAFSTNYRQPRVLHSHFTVHNHQKVYVPSETHSTHNLPRQQGALNSTGAC